MNAEMMNVDTMREQLHNYIDNMDEQRLKQLFSSVEEELPIHKVYNFSDEDIAYLDERRELHINGKGESYTWEEVREMIRQKRGI